MQFSEMHWEKFTYRNCPYKNLVRNFFRLFASLNITFRLIQLLASSLIRHYPTWNRFFLLCQSVCLTTSYRTVCLKCMVKSTQTYTRTLIPSITHTHSTQRTGVQTNAWGITWHLANTKCQKPYLEILQLAPHLNLS